MHYPVNIGKSNKPEPMFKKLDKVMVRGSSDLTPRPITRLEWNKEYSEWMYFVPPNIAPLFGKEIVKEDCSQPRQ